MEQNDTTTNGGSTHFDARSTALDVIAGRDLQGKDAIVTGGASGIGIETVRALASAGARVTIATRNQSQAESTAAQLRQDTKNPAIEVGSLDLASIASVRAFTKDWLATHPALHILINNAGIMATPQSYTEDGLELQFGTNHIGHFALTTGLLPALKAAGGARVVSLSSSGHRLSDVHFEDLNFRTRDYAPFLAYGQSKTANALFAVGLTQRHAANGITANAVMPGGIITGLQKHMSREEQIRLGWFDESGKVNERFKSVEQGAATSIWAAVAPELEGVGGLYLEDCAIAKPLNPESPYSGYMPYALNPEHAEQLWTVSEAIVGR